MRKKIELVYFNAGGGHRAAALALQEVMRMQGRPWELRLTNLFEAIDSRGLFRKLTGFEPEDYYNKRLAKGWTLGLAQELRLLQGLIKLGHGSLVNALQQHWLASEPDLVVSLIPNFNRALCESVHATLPGVPFVTVLTDLADYPPNFWIEPGQDQHLVCGSERALAQARAAGYADERISLSSGMILRPAFYEPASAKREAVLSALGLDPQRPTGVVMFGGHGSNQMLRIARALRHRQLILLCGHNEALAATLRAERGTAAHAVIGFSSDVPNYLRLGDYFIGKPGPASLSEALHLGLPVITFSSIATMPQERYNTRWVREQGLGLVLRGTREIDAAVGRLLADLPAYRQRLAALDNRAVFELPEIFADLLHAAALPRRLDEPQTRRALRWNPPRVRGVEVQP